MTRTSSCWPVVDLLRRDARARPTGRDVLLRLGSRTGAPKIAIPLAPSRHQRAPLVGRPLSRSAERDARRLDREGMAWSKALAYPIRAGVAAARDDTSQAASMFAQAVTQLEAVDMNLYGRRSHRADHPRASSDGVPLCVFAPSPDCGLLRWESLHPCIEAIYQNV